jgi:hypothetical protein
MLFILNKRYIYNIEETKIIYFVTKLHLNNKEVDKLYKIILLEKYQSLVFLKITEERIDIFCYLFWSTIESRFIVFDRIVYSHSLNTVIKLFSLFQTHPNILFI